MNVELDLDSDGRPLVVKRPETPAEADRVRDEISVLDRTAGTGAIALHPSTDRFAPRLVTNWMPGGTLAEPAEGRLPLDRYAEIVAEAADMVAALHGIGLTHTRIDAHHVLIDGAGRAVLTGLSRATPLPMSAPGADIDALAALVAARLGQEPNLPGLGEALSAAIDHHHRSSATALAQSIRAALDAEREPRPTPVATLPRVVAPKARASRSIASLEWGRIGAVAAALATLAFAAFAAKAIFSANGNTAGAEFTSAPPVDPGTTASLSTNVVPSTPVDASTTVVVSTTVAPASTVAHQVWPSTTVPAVAPMVIAEGKALTDGRLVVGDRTYRLSVAPGDLVVVADWDCDGTSTPAVLHLPSGAIDVFDRFSTGAGDRIDGRRVAVVARAAAINAVAAPGRGAACADPEVVTDNGAHEIVTVAR